MSAKENKRSIIVGLFVFIGLVILVTGILVLGGQQGKFRQNLLVTTYFHDVKGLKVGNNVWFSGVKVGIIKEITFESIENVKVVMLIDERSHEYIRKDVAARLGSDGLIGNSIINLVGGSNSAPPIQDGDVVKSEKSTDTEALMATLQKNNENLVDITKNFAIISQDLVDGKGLIGAMLSDSSMTLSIKQSLASLSTVLKEANKASANLAQLSNKLNGDQGLIHDLTTDTEVFNSLRQSAAQLQGVTQTASALMTNLHATSERLNDKNNAVGALTNDPQVANDIRKVVSNLNSSTEKLNENMEALKHNFLFRGYFKKQAKKEQESSSKVDSLRN